jgi:hypothetical protein
MLFDMLSDRDKACRLMGRRCSRLKGTHLDGGNANDHFALTPI